MSDSVKVHTERLPFHVPPTLDHAEDPPGFDREIGALTAALATSNLADPVPASLSDALARRASEWQDRDLLMASSQSTTLARTRWSHSVWARTLATAAAVVLMVASGYAWMNRDSFDPTEPGLVREMNRMIDDAPDVALASFASDSFGTGRIAFSAEEQVGYLDIQSLQSDRFASSTVSLAIMIDDADGNATSAGTVNVHCFSLNRFVAPFTPDQPIDEPMFVRLIDLDSNRTLLSAALMP